ncbi:hypothetical protein [Anabaena lutea]|nr:hypothetical protein [Anabaena lutea]
MDDYEATKYIKSTTKGNATVVIALTASVLEEEKAIALTERRRHRSLSRL